MAVYCITQDLYDRFGQQEITQASDHEGDGTVNIEAISTAIEDASRVIDRYLSTRYILPLTCIPLSLVGICCNLARYNLHDDHATDTIKDGRSNAIKQLEMIVDKKMDLQDDVCGDVFTEITKSNTVVVARARIFTDDVLCKMRIK